VATTFSILLLVPVGTQSIFAASISLDLDAEMTVGSGSTVTINTDDSSTLANQGTIDIHEFGIINVGSGSSSLTLLSNDGTINGPGIINLFGIDIDVQDNGIITAIINEFFSDGSTVVGGEIIPTETTSLLLAGTQTIMFWLLPVIVIIGVSIFFMKNKRSEWIHE